jgi:hypothetical protein
LQENAFGFVVVWVIERLRAPQSGPSGPVTARFQGAAELYQRDLGAARNFFQSASQTSHFAALCSIPPVRGRGAPEDSADAAHRRSLTDCAQSAQIRRGQRTTPRGPRRQHQPADEAPGRPGGLRPDHGLSGPRQCGRIVPAPAVSSASAAGTASTNGLSPLALGVSTSASASTSSIHRTGLIFSAWVMFFGISARSF